MKRILAQDVWYEVRTAVNNREPLFRLRQAATLFFRTLCESRGLFAFEIRGLRLEGGRLSFYIRPACGFQLPVIMQWLKQTFAVRFNGQAGRTGHIWGDRYWSRILTGDPPEWAEWADWGAVEAAAETQAPAAKARMSFRVSPRPVGKPAKLHFSPKIPFRSPFPSG
ncbi:MAG: hypothetical protein LBF74_10465 [Treponema sp.]|nr:hypothetical protein [Treponema sp.]